MPPDISQLLLHCITSNITENPSINESTTALAKDMFTKCLYGKVLKVDLTVFYS